ncbi:acylphosphatase [Edwardsiella ictaluri]|uniref:acylphosphatase n=1 Tax=Edwardsiella ictaluri TaxID=67780 RepID=UPI0018DDF169|nr:acylphosphatase [Edwardsiella ictaluri]QPW29716.1 acylphosphatase [Edwardsiella ictaluri]UYB62836.1 acylphosphatase [Edwardsiella ictaluri]UYB66062.1 acylphosphatase [Edwardsiella ictaluri]WJH20750.1 acylphosphatase [Edwardsiella ictaluri]BEH98525.1 acylphosphatase [Edwardsiella ictaluri]
MGIACVAAYVSGRVQGVGFRYGTRCQAMGLGLTGYALNLDDGRVEVLAEGESQAVTQLLRWLSAGGPRYTRVDRVDTEPRPLQHFQRFEIRY